MITYVKYKLTVNDAYNFFDTKKEAIAQYDKVKYICEQRDMKLKIHKCSTIISDRKEVYLNDVVIRELKH